MEIQGRATTRLKYRFSNLAQARAHLRDVEDRALFFFRDDTLRLLPWAPVCLEFSFEDGTAARLLHGCVMDSLEGSGTWLELTDTSPVRSDAAYTRQTRRLGCDLPVEVRAPGQIETGQLLDLSPGGARIMGVSRIQPGQAVELRLLSSDRLTFRDLSFGNVSWTRGQKLGVQFDPADSIGRSAVARLLGETEELWRRAWESLHPVFCCGDRGVIEPDAPRLRGVDDVTGKIAL